MPVIRTVASVMGCIKMVVDLIDKNKERGGELAAGLDCIKEDLDLIKARLVEDEELHRQPLMQLKLQELAYTIDDFVHDLWIPGPFGGIVLVGTGLDPRPEDIKRISGFKDRAKTLREDLDKRPQWTKSDSRKTQDVCSPSAGSPSYALEKDLVGIAEPKGEIVDLLSRRPGDGSLRVISIAGRSGVGKTALARALYQDEDVVKEFQYKAWVVTSNNSSADILSKISDGIVSTSATTSTPQDGIVSTSATTSTPQELKHFAKDQRYLVFVDDVQRGTACRDIKDAFRENVMDSRIIVTTSVPSVALECSSGSFMYTMQGLDKENSRELFRRKFRGEAGYSEEDKYRLGNKEVDAIVDKCDGLPIALISAAECLRGKDIKNPNTENFEVSKELGDTLACSESKFEQYKGRNTNEATLVEMRRAFVEPYEKLLNNGEKDCLLYASIFPSGYQINSRSLVRILIAEGLGPEDPHIMKASEFVVADVRDCLRMFMDQGMIDPVPIRSNCNAAKRCRVHSLMLQFTIKKAVSRNLVSLIHKGEPQYTTAGSVRRLTIQSSSDARCTGQPEEMDLSVLRSLSIFESGIVNFEKCKRVRVLSLEGCTGLTPEVLDNICRLVFLKYLSLRNTGILELPRNVENLKFLETLDTRDTRGTQDTVVIKLPVEVLTLPRFAYLFGKFELINVHSNNMEKLIKFFSEKKSQLHTLGGIAVHEEKGQEIVLLVVQHATKLKKVKVWYRDTPSSTGPVTTSTPEPRLFSRVMRKLNPSKLFSKQKPSAGPAADPAPATSTPVASGTPGLPCAGQLADSSSNAQDSAPTTSTPVAGGTPGFPSAGPSADSCSNAHDPTPATSTPVADGTPGLSTRKWNTLLKPKWKWIRTRLFRRWKLSARQSEARRRGMSSTQGPLTNYNSNAPVAGGTPGLPSAGPSADSNSNAQDPGPSTSTPVASGTPEPFPCVSRLTETLRERSIGSIGLDSVSVDFNGVPNTFLDFIQNNGPISSIKLRKGLGILPRPEHLGEVCNLKKLHLFSTALKIDELGALQYLKCLQYLKLAEEGHGLWSSKFHVKAGGFISLIWLCFESSNSKHPPLMIDEGVKTPLASLLLLCKETDPHGGAEELGVEGLSRLANLNEVILDPSATDGELTAWKEEAKKHINRPYVEKQQV